MGGPAFKLEKEIKVNNIKVFSSNYALYADMSRRVMGVLDSLVGNLEIYSIDEAFMLMNGEQNITEQSIKIKQMIKQWTGIPVSIGIGRTKVLAKVANDIAKKNKKFDGVLDLSDKNVDGFLERLPVKDLWGIGRQYVKLLNYENIFNALQLKNTNDNWVRKHLTVQGLRLVYELRGISCIPLEDAAPPQKNVASTRSFGRRVTTLNELKEVVATYVTRAAEKLRKQGLVAGYIYVFINTNRFSEKDKQYANGAKTKLPIATSHTPLLINIAHTLLERIYKPGYQYWKAGIICMDLQSDTETQQTLFNEFDTEKFTTIMRTMDKINSKHGRNRVRSGAMGFNLDWNMKRRKLSQKYTTNWQQIPVARA